MRRLFCVVCSWRDCRVCSSRVLRIGLEHAFAGNGGNGVLTAPGGGVLMGKTEEIDGGGGGVGIVISTSRQPRRWFTCTVYFFSPQRFFPHSTGKGPKMCVLPLGEGKGLLYVLGRACLALLTACLRA